MKRNKGFTLIEVLFVIAILAALAGLAIPRITGTILQSRRDTCNANMAIVNSQLELYRLDTGAYPLNNDEFNNEVFLDNRTYFTEKPTCPFGTAYVFDNTNNTNRVIETGHYNDHT